MKTTILGNSGSGKTTLAASLAAKGDWPVLNLDSIVWEPGKIAVARPPEKVKADLEAFCAGRDSWVVEGCYADLAEITLRWRPELILLDPGEAECLRRCRARPWEPDKYATKADQDSKLEFLLSWVSDFYRRQGPMSAAGHRAVYDAYHGPKRVVS